MFKYLGLLIIVSCVVFLKPKRAVVEGTYEFNPVYGVWNSLELKDDSSFLFQWRTGLIAGETSGDWDIIGNKLILNSERQEEINPAHYKLIRAEKTLSDSVTIEVLTSEDSLPSFFSMICVKKDSVSLCKNNGLEALPVSFLNNKPDSILIDVFSYRKVCYKISNSEFNNYVFMLERYDNTFYKYFKNEEFTFKINRLYDKNFKKNKYVKKNYYEKIPQKKASIIEDY